MKRVAIVLAMLILGTVLLGCSAEQRSDCVVCNVTGLCRLLGDDPNAAMRKHPVWFGLPSAPASASGGDANAVAKQQEPQ